MKAYKNSKRSINNDVLWIFLVVHFVRVVPIGISAEIVRFQVDAAEIIATLSIGGIGFIMLVMGIFGLWECWRKRVN